jgi:ribosomal protein S18 acetylase RimI-like enzyme
VGGLGILEQDFGVGGWWIMGLYVRSTHRGLGVGEALTQALIEQARCENAEAVYCNVFVTNIPSKRLFEKLGFIPAEKEIQEKLNQAYQQISTSMPETIVLKYPLVQTDTEKGD